MKLLFVKGRTTFSKTICAVTEEDVSHVALMINLGGFDFVIHSNLLGLHIETYGNFSKHCDIKYILEKKEDPSDITRLMKLLAQYEWSFYDFGAILFLGLSLLVRRWLKIPLPKSNLWQTTGMFMCVEWISKYVDLEEESMCTPKRLYYILLGHPDWN